MGGDLVLIQWLSISEPVRTTHMRKRKLCLHLISCGVSEQKRYGGQRCYDGINLDKNELGLVVYQSPRKKILNF